MFFLFVNVVAAICSYLKGFVSYITNCLELLAVQRLLGQDVGLQPKN